VDYTVLGKQLFNAREEKLLLLKVRDFINDGRVASFEAVNVLVGGDLTQNGYWTIWRAISRILQNPANRAAGRPNDWIHVLGRSKKGSSMFRKILEVNSKVDKSENICIRYANTCGVIKPDLNTYKWWCGYWNSNFLPISIRLFVLQLVNNSLPVKARLAHRTDQYIDESCSVCAAGFDVRQRETFRHVFFECPSTTMVIEAYGNKYNGGNAVTDAWLLFGISANETYCPAENLISLLLLYSIWYTRLNNKRVGWLTIEDNMSFLYKGILKASKKCLEMTNNSNNGWCRHWGENRHGRG